MQPVHICAQLLGASRHIAQLLAAAGEVLKLQLSHAADYVGDQDAVDPDADDQDADADHLNKSVAGRTHSSFCLPRTSTPAVAVTPQS